MTETDTDDRRPAERHYCPESIFVSYLGMAGEECPNCGEVLKAA